MRPVALDRRVKHLAYGDTVDPGLAGAGTIACLSEQAKPRQPSDPSRSARRDRRHVIRATPRHR